MKITFTNTITLLDDFRYLAQDYDGCWYAYMEKPTIDNDWEYWHGRPCELVTLTPPHPAHASRILEIRDGMTISDLTEEVVAS